MPGGVIPGNLEQLGPREGTSQVERGWRESPHRLWTLVAGALGWGELQAGRRGCWELGSPTAAWPCPEATRTTKRFNR